MTLRQKYEALQEELMTVQLKYQRELTFFRISVISNTIFFYFSPCLHFSNSDFATKVRGFTRRAHDGATQVPEGAGKTREGEQGPQEKLDA